MDTDLISRLKNYVENKTGLPIIDIIYVIDLLIVFWGSNITSFNLHLFKWQSLDIGGLLYNVGLSIYSNRAPSIICIIFCVIIALMLAVNDKTNVFNMLPEEVEYTDNTVRGYNPVVAIKRLPKILWYIYHNLWIMFLSLMILCGMSIYNLSATDFKK